ncbi:alpha-amylase family glycosyl hydrolase [Janthinobacterium sp.]|uniref:alpha-amylase family glycosyl hydrolase n=1 Tax=Janthinobacterium sp. TaxID=1871054 RepID=UPI00293D43FB|nr:alpha-amylase family glycosyl hydrolase [Janthinobacterium sp.]
MRPAASRPRIPGIAALAMLALLAVRAGAAPAAAPAGDFARNPIVYFAITDRFANGNPDNDHSYGRAADGAGEAGTFHGGDLAGLTQKLREGYFSALGVNALWISAPYEQIHGWVAGGKQSFRHYAYHGYWALDYTTLDANMGSREELRDMIDTAHAQGIRVLFDVVMNHPGYADLRTLADYRVPVLWPGHEKATLADYHSYIDYNNFDFAKWWGPDWVRAGLPGYQEGGSDDFTMQLAYLADFRTESAQAVGLPPILLAKADTRARALPDTGVRGYLVSWLSAWVREFGVDGFRCDTVKHVEPDSWRALKSAATVALADWKARHPQQKIDDAPFWMTGEAWGHGPERSAWHDAGFDSMINFDFQARAGADWPALDAQYRRYAALLAEGAPHDMLSYISSHDTLLFPRAELRHGLSALLLAPGGVQLFYGDESARPPGLSPEGDPQQNTRSDMNWATPDAALLAHARKLGRFRARHVALARGAHTQLSLQPYAFARIDKVGGDRVLVAPDTSGELTLAVRGVFADGARLRDAYSGRPAVVRDGAVSLRAEGSVLLEAAP